MRNDDSDLLKIGDAAFIRREDLDGLLIRGRTTAKHVEIAAQARQKCDGCFRSLESEDQITELCAAEGCGGLICDRCWSEGTRYCVKHIPDRVQKWESAWDAHQRGELPLLVKGSHARLQEINFLNRIETRVQQINTLIHPVTEDVLTVTDWETHREDGDERAELMKLLGTMMLDTGTTTRVPLNVWVRWDLPKGKRQDGLPLRIRMQVLSRMSEMLRDGFDTLPLGEEELTRRLIQLGEESEKDQVITLVALAATTGWDSAARRTIQGDAPGKAFMHRHLLIYLFDLQRGELIYNLFDDRLRGYIELFAPALPEEENQEVIAAIEREFLIHDSLSLETAVETLPYSASVLQTAFERLAATGKYALTELPEIGTVIIQV
jgi:hypothetical protein